MPFLSLLLLSSFLAFFLLSSSSSSSSRDLFDFSTWLEGFLNVSVRPSIALAKPSSFGSSFTLELLPLLRLLFSSFLLRSSFFLFDEEEPSSTSAVSLRKSNPLSTGGVSSFSFFTFTSDNENPSSFSFGSDLILCLLLLLVL